MLRLALLFSADRGRVRRGCSLNLARLRNQLRPVSTPVGHLVRRVRDRGGSAVALAARTARGGDRGGRRCDDRFVRRVAHRRVDCGESSGPRGPRNDAPLGRALFRCCRGGRGGGWPRRAARLIGERKALVARRNASEEEAGADDGAEDDEKMPAPLAARTTRRPGLPAPARRCPSRADTDLRPVRSASTTRRKIQ